jgi:hypothetical protein
MMKTPLKRAKHIFITIFLVLYIFLDFKGFLLGFVLNKALGKRVGVSFFSPKGWEAPPLF